MHLVGLAATKTCITTNGICEWKPVSQDMLSIGAGTSQLAIVVAVFSVTAVSMDTTHPQSQAHRHNKNTLCVTCVKVDVFSAATAELSVSGLKRSPVCGEASPMKRRDVEGRGAITEGVQTVLLLSVELCVCA